MWLIDLLPGQSAIRPTRPTSKNYVGRDETVVAVAPSDTSDTSDIKNSDGEIFEETASPESQKPLEVKIDYAAFCSGYWRGCFDCPDHRPGNSYKMSFCDRWNRERQVAPKSDESKKDELQSIPENEFVACPKNGGKWHVWYCGRCADADTCQARHNSAEVAA